MVKRGKTLQQRTFTSEQNNSFLEVDRSF